MQYSFVETDDKGKVVSMWNPEVTGDYIVDCAKGRDYADEVIAGMKRDENPALLGWIVRGFGQDQVRRGVEAGFCQAIAQAAMS